MKDYQRQKGNRYILPRTLYHQTVWQIRDYYRLKEQADAILEESPPPPDGQPHGTSIGDQVAVKAIRRETMLSTVRVIEKEKQMMMRHTRNDM